MWLNSLIGQKDTTDLQKQVSELGDKLKDVQTSMQSVGASVCTKKKSLIPKDLCVGFFIGAQPMYVNMIAFLDICEEPSFKACPKRKI